MRSAPSSSAVRSGSVASSHSTTASGSLATSLTTCAHDNPATAAVANGLRDCLAAERVIAAHRSSSRATFASSQRATDLFDS
jgi:hypothetical protein